MDKVLGALERLYIAGDLELDYVLGGKQKDDYDLVEKELKALESIKQKGIAFLVPNSDYANEHIHIDIYTNTLSKEELKMIKEVLGL